MATLVLIHGGGGSAWDWHLLAPELAGRGHDVVVAEPCLVGHDLGVIE
jgi:pimeloyl-ACP methyl ester carboxylesterase